jgi:hypothetical protein
MPNVQTDYLQKLHYKYVYQMAPPLHKHTAKLDIPSLPHASRQAHILPGLDQQSLLSVGNMCDIGCAVIFTAKKVAARNVATTI